LQRGTRAGELIEPIHRRTDVRVAQVVNGNKGIPVMLEKTLLPAKT
jgi:hypothetical protein